MGSDTIWNVGSDSDTSALSGGRMMGSGNGDGGGGEGERRGGGGGGGDDDGGGGDGGDGSGVVGVGVGALEAEEAGLVGVQQRLGRLAQVHVTGLGRQADRAP